MKSDGGQADRSAKRAPRRRGNGQGTAIKRGNTWTAVWTVEVYVEPGTMRLKQRQKWKGGFATKREALIYAANPPVEEKRRPTLRDYWNSWSVVELPGLSKSRAEAFEIAWKKLEGLAGIAMCGLTIGQLQAVVDEKGPTYYTARDMRTVLSHLFKRAVAEGNARANLAQYIKIPPLKEAEQQPFTDVEIKKLWGRYAEGDRVVGCILLMIYTGMMPGELLQLKADMIDQERQEIVGAGLKTKKRKETPIVYPDVIAPVLEQLISTSASRAGYVLGMNKDTFYEEYYAALERAEVRRLPPYSCRHTTATALALVNVAPSTIQEVMRHTKFSTTQRYIHPGREAARAAVNRLAAGNEK